MVASAAKIEVAGNAGYQNHHMNEIFREGMSFSGYERDCLYLNVGQGKFREISGVSGIDSITDGRGSLFADFDNDGDLDVVVTTIQKNSRLLFRNNVGQNNGFLRVTLQGTSSGREALGATVRLKTPLGIQTKVRTAGSGFISSNDPRLLFGFGPESSIEWLEVAWPSGRTQRFTGIRPGQSLKIVEESESPERIVEKRLSLVDPESWDARAWRSLAIKKGEVMPSVQVTDVSSETAGTLTAKLKPGRRTLVNFWATWCVPCRDEMKELQSLLPRLQAAGVDLIGVSLDFGQTARVRDFLRDNGIRYPILIAAEGSLDKLLSGDDLGVPFSLLLDEKGALLAAYSGWTPQTRQSIEKLAGRD